MAKWQSYCCGIIVTERVPPFVCPQCSGAKKRGWVYLGGGGRAKPQRKKRGKIGPERRARLYERDGNACVECSSETNLTLDHIIPASKGGTTEDDNLQTMCESCNVAKGNLVAA